MAGSFLYYQFLIRAYVIHKIENVTKYVHIINRIISVKPAKIIFYSIFLFVLGFFVVVLFLQNHIMKSYC